MGSAQIFSLHPWPGHLSKNFEKCSAPTNRIIFFKISLLPLRQRPDDQKNISENLAASVIARATGC